MSNILFPEQEEYLQLFHVGNDPLITEMELFAADNKIPILEKSAAKFLEQLVYMYSPKKFLEIGMAIGYSTIRVAKILPKSTYIASIELSKNNIKLAKSFIERANLENEIDILEGNALDILPSLSQDFDFIFLDADKEDYLDLFSISLNLLKVGGIILVDNLLWKGFAASEEVPKNYKKSTELIRKFNAKFLGHPNLNSNILPIGDGLGLGIKIQ